MKKNKKALEQVHFQGWTLLANGNGCVAIPDANPLASMRFESIEAAKQVIRLAHEQRDQEKEKEAI